MNSRQLPMFILDSGAARGSLHLADCPGVRLSAQRSAGPCALRRRGPPAPSDGFRLPPWWSELDGDRPVVHVTQGTIDNADLGRLVEPTIEALGGEDVIVVATTGGRDIRS